MRWTTGIHRWRLQKPLQNGSHAESPFWTFRWSSKRPYRKPSKPSIAWPNTNTTITTRHGWLSMAILLCLHLGEKSQMHGFQGMTRHDPQTRKATLIATIVSPLRGFASGRKTSAPAVLGRACNLMESVLDQHFRWPTFSNLTTIKAVAVVCNRLSTSKFQSSDVDIGF